MSSKLTSEVTAPAPPPLYRLRPLQIGDIGWIVHRQALLYAQEYALDARFEALVAQITGSFVQKFKPGRENAWVAARDGAVLGAVFVVQRSPTLAQLRLLYVEPSARGLGIGKRLTKECVDFARAAGYRRLVLWTNDVLIAARHIYLAAGFKLKREERHEAFGMPMLGQHWELALTPRSAVARGRAGSVQQVR